MMSTYLHPDDDGVAQHVAPEPIGGLNVKWKDVGSVKPSSGVEIDNAALAAALQNDTEFSMADMVKFKVLTLSYDAFIQAGDRYYMPASLPPISERRKLLVQLRSRAQDFEQASDNRDQHPVFGPGSKIKSADAFIDEPAADEFNLLSATLQKRIVAKVLFGRRIALFIHDACASKTDLVLVWQTIFWSDRFVTLTSRKVYIRYFLSAIKHRKDVWHCAVLFDSPDIARDFFCRTDADSLMAENPLVDYST
jgi:hypothetical protein